MGTWEGEMCEYCGGSIIEKRGTRHRKVKTRYLLLEKVPAGFCVQCGTRFYSANGLKTIQGSIRGRRKADGRVAVPIVLPLAERRKQDQTVGLPSHLWRGTGS
jgi:YgiT-type zinc finger domain-containing protein